MKSDESEYIFRCMSDHVFMCRAFSVDAAARVARVQRRVQRRLLRRV